MPAVKIGTTLHLNLCMWHTQCNSHIHTHTRSLAQRSFCVRKCIQHFHSMHNVYSLKMHFPGENSTTTITIHVQQQQQRPIHVFQLSIECWWWWWWAIVGCWFFQPRKIIMKFSENIIINGIYQCKRANNRQRKKVLEIALSKVYWRRVDWSKLKTNYF